MAKSQKPRHKMAGINADRGASPPPGGRPQCRRGTRMTWPNGQEWRDGPNPAVALLFKCPGELIASPVSCPGGRTQISFFQRAGDVYCGHSSQATRCKAKEIVMGNRFSGLIVTAAIAAVASAAIAVSVTRAQAPAVSGAALKTAPLKTAWGEPD